jgi:hypothetical protein
MNPDKPRCKALTKSGQPCGAAPTRTGLCFFHGDPNKASVLGRIGGKRNRPPKGENAHPVLKLNGAASASERLELLYHEVETGSIRPPVANVLIKLTDLQVRVQEKTVIEDQIANLQEQLRILKSTIAMRDFETSMSEVEDDETEDDEAEDNESKP